MIDNVAEEVSGMAINLRPAYERISWRGVTLSRRTVAALKWAEKKSGVYINPSQGSYTNAVAASAGTHGGGGAVDLRVRHANGIYLSAVERARLVRALKDAGFAAWYRTQAQGFPPHIHALDIGSKDMAWGARSQVASFDRHRDGLSGDRYDDTYRPNPKKKFSYVLNRPVNR